MGKEDFVWPCVKCLDGRLHPWHDSGAVNEPHMDWFQDENPVFDKDKDARDYEANRD